MSIFTLKACSRIVCLGVHQSQSQPSLVGTGKNITQSVPCASEQPLFPPRTVSHSAIFSIYSFTAFSFSSGHLSLSGLIICNSFCILYISPTDCQLLNSRNFVVFTANSPSSVIVPISVNIFLDKKKKMNPCQVYSLQLSPLF